MYRQNSPRRDRFGGPIHTERGLTAGRRLSLAAMDKYVEIQRVPKKSGGMRPSSAEKKPIRAGRVRAGIAVGTRGDEKSAPKEGTNPNFEWEFIFPLGTAVNASDRFAWPAFFTEWQPGTIYKIGAIVTPTNWTSGSSPFFEAVKAGVSGAIQPEWPAQLHYPVADAAMIWRLVGWATKFEVIAAAVAASNPTRLTVRAKELG